jgi:hypothetical protein
MDRAAFPRSLGGGTAEQVGGPTKTLGLIAQDSLQHRGRARLASLENTPRLVICDLVSTAGVATFGLNQPKV